MRTTGTRAVQVILGAVLFGLASWPGAARGQSGVGSAGAEAVRIIGIQGEVEIMPPGATAWVLTATNQTLQPSYRLRTRSNSRVCLLWSDHSVVNFGELTELEILPPQDPDALPGLHLIKGLLSFFHRDRPGRIRVVTRGAVAGVEGTDFVLAVDSVNEQERTTLSVIDGRVLLSNDRGSVVLTNDQQGVAEAGRAPVPTAGFIANNILQWCFYYPGVLDAEEVPLTADERQALRESLAAYRAGDLLQALARYPATAAPGSPAEQLYHAALLLAVGQVEKTEAALAALPRGGQSEDIARLALALRTLIAAVKRLPNPSTAKPQLATECLAVSYYEQSRAQGDQSLRAALDLARQAAARSPRFGFAWERVAELEFDFGHTGASLTALDRSLALAPRNAQALALKGFLLAAQNRPGRAYDWFNRAIAVDSGLANAWLGRGLCRMHQGDAAGGVEDLMVAAALEPQRALLRSYLGKAYTATDDFGLAGKELKLAINLDPNDPTAWLYSALLKQQENRVNEAIGDLEASQARNDNRSLFRSRLLLDEDLAVSSANLASIYRDAGMTDVSVREAARAVTYDYANASAHLFLSDSYNDLRDPTRFNLRYETVWFNELLLANLLAPVGGGRLSQNVSQEEYSSLFQANGLGIANSTQGRTDNKSVNELASQFGTFGQTSYALDLDYYHNGGVRPNNELDSIEWYSTIKQQITPQDTLLALVKYEDYNSGDNFQYYYQTNARPNYQYQEYQQPIVVGGWHHEWGPGAHTLLLGGRVATEQYFNDIGAQQLLLFQNPSGTPYFAANVPLNVHYHGNSEVYLAEANQIFQLDRITLSLGGRWQGGSFQTDARFVNSLPIDGYLFNDPAAQASLDEGFQRLTGYSYLTVEPLEHLWLIGGFAYDDLDYPSNFRNPPLSSGQSHADQLGPKAGFVWSPVSLFTVRGAYTESLGGVSADESYRLEQTQVAGFPQAFRSLISESLVGSVSAPEYQTYSAAMDFKFPSRTYAGVQIQELKTDVSRTVGDLILSNGVIPAVSSSTPEHLDYRETSVGGSLNQLLGDMVVVGTGYSFNRATLDDAYPKLKLKGFNTTEEADLQVLSGYVLFNHPSGFFARADANWYHQYNTGYSPGLPADSFIQENVYVGYRFFHRHAEVMFGVLNLSDQDYHLNPLNTYSDLPRERAFTLRIDFVF